MRDQRGASLIVLVLILAIVGLTVWFVVNRIAASSVERLADIGVPLDETDQQVTMADMKVIGDAIRLMQADTGSPPTTLIDLQVKGYLQRVPTTDGWGNAWAYSTGRSSFELHSLGSDGRVGPAPPQPWTGGSHACDLIMVNGQFTQAPSGS